MEELLRFVAIRAPELAEPNDEQSIVPLKTNSNFQLQITQAEPEMRSHVSQEYIESTSFIADPGVNDIGAALLKSIRGVDLSKISAKTLARKIIQAINDLIEEDSSLGQNSDIRETLQALVEQSNWKEFRVQLADSFIALSLFQESQIRSTNQYELVLRLIHFVEQAAAKGFDDVKPQKIFNAVLATQISLAPKAPRPQNEGEELSPTEDPSSERVKNLRNINRAAEFLLSLPRAKLVPVEVEEPVVSLESNPSDIGLQPADDVNPTETVASGKSGIFYTVKESALEELEVDVREVILDRLAKLDVNDVSLAIMALRHDEHEIYSKALPMPGKRVRGTTLSLANTALTSNISIREVMDIVLNPGVTFNPDILGSEVFGALILPRFGPLGIGELMVVRQNLKTYAALDVAHIENVLQGESKEREHRRKRLTEETFFTESESELEEERDTQTSERFELRSEVEEEVRETFKFDAGVKVTAQLGPFVELEADARFGYENAKTEGRKKASQYSQETTERAATRFAERVLERRERRLVEEVEELNRHGIDATSANANITGIYQWISKIYEAQVFNYGLREMYEFFLPEPATFYIGSLVSKGLSDGNAPTPPPPFTVSPNTLNRSNYKYYSSLYNASSVPAPPEEFIKVDLAQAGGPLDFDSSENGNVAAAFSIKLTDGYEYFGYRWRARYTYRGDDFDFEVSVSDEFGDPGSVPVWIKGHRIVSWAIWVHITCRVTETLMDDWRLKAWEAMRDGHVQMQREYEEKIAAAAVQQGVEITGRNPLANERIIRDEVQRQCISALANKSPSGNNGMSGIAGNVAVDWEKAYTKGLYTRFMHQAFEWENVSYVFYPFFWARKSRWLELFNVEDTDPDFQTFLQSGMARVVLPIRPGFEHHIEHFRRTGQIWSGGQPPTIGDPDFLSIASEIKAQTGAPGDEEPVGEPWDIVVPTQLVKLRQDNQLPKWRKNQQGQWVEDNTQ